MSIFKLGLPNPIDSGKTHGKDIMLLCKGYYDREKYKSTRAALQRYYEERYQYGEPYEELSLGFINEVLLKPALQELLSDKFKMQFIEYIFKPFVFGTIGKKDLSYDEDLYYRLIEFLHSMRVKEDNYETIINTGDYFTVEGNDKKLVESIIS